MEIKKMLTEASIEISRNHNQIGIWILAFTSAYDHGREKWKELNVT